MAVSWTAPRTLRAVPGFSEERCFSHEQARPFAWAYAGIVVLGLLVSLPYWRLLGVL